MTTKNKNIIKSEELTAAMDIVRGMSYEEIQELLKSNPLYKFVTELTEKKEPKNGI